MTINAIWKFILEPEDQQEIEMPIGAELLSVAMQNDLLCLWAQVDPTAKPYMRRIEIKGTGHEFDASEGIVRKFIGTVLWAEEHLVFHVFERLAP